MKKARRIVSLFLVVMLTTCLCMPTFAASSTSDSVDYYETENWSLWGEKDEDGTLYVIMSYNNGDVYVSKTNVNSEDSPIYGAEFTNISRALNTEELSYEYWQSLKKIAIENASEFKSVSGLSVTQSVERATTAENLTLNYLVSKNGSAYSNKLLKTDTTSYPGTTIQVRANLSLGAQEGSIIAIEATKTVADVVALVCKRIPQLSSAATVAQVVSTACAVIINAYGVYTQNGTLAPVYGSAVATRFCTVNYGSTTYSEARKQTVYAAMYCKTTGGFDCRVHDTSYSPSEYCFGNSNAYLWLITTAYNNYS